MLVPVPVVGVVRIPGPTSALDLKEASSSVLISGIGSCNNGSGWIAGGVTNSELGVGAGVVLRPASAVPTGSGWVEKCAQLLQGLFQLEAVINHAPHHLYARVGRGLLQAVVV